MPRAETIAAANQAAEDDSRHVLYDEAEKYIDSLLQPMVDDVTAAADHHVKTCNGVINRKVNLQDKVFVKDVYHAAYVNLSVRRIAKYAGCTEGRLQKLIKCGREEDAHPHERLFLKYFDQLRASTSIETMMVAKQAAKKSPGLAWAMAKATNPELRPAEKPVQQQGATTNNFLTVIGEMSTEQLKAIRDGYEKNMNEEQKEKLALVIGNNG